MNSNDGDKGNNNNNKEKGSKNSKTEELFAKLDLLAQEEKIQQRKDEAVAKREEGNQWYKDQKFGMAIQCYTDAMELNPDDVTNVSNRSNAFFAGRFYEESIRDARICIKMDKTFAKGYYRLAVALNDLGKPEDALMELENGLNVVKKGKKALSQLKMKIRKQHQITDTNKNKKNEDHGTTTTATTAPVTNSTSITNNSKKNKHQNGFNNSICFTDAIVENNIANANDDDDDATAKSDVVVKKKMSKFKRERLKMKQQHGI